MTPAQTDILMLWLGLGGLAMFAGVLAFVSLNPRNATRHPDGASGMARDNLFVLAPGLLLMALLVLRGVTPIEGTAIWPVPLVVIGLGSILWMRMPAVRRAGERIARAHRRPTR